MGAAPVTRQNNLELAERLQNNSQITRMPEQRQFCSTMGISEVDYASATRNMNMDKKANPDPTISTAAKEFRHDRRISPPLRASSARMSAANRQADVRAEPARPEPVRASDPHAARHVPEHLRHRQEHSRGDLGDLRRRPAMGSG